MTARRIDASVVSPMEHDFDYPQTVILKRAATRALVTVVTYLDCSDIFGARIPTFVKCIYPKCQRFEPNKNNFWKIDCRNNVQEDVQLVHEDVQLVQDLSGGRPEP